MLFRATRDPQNPESFTATAIKMDPWEFNAFHNNPHNKLNRGSLQLNTWYSGAWPATPDEPTEVADDGNSVYYRRPVDYERLRRWQNGERFQVTQTEW